MGPFDDLLGDSAGIVAIRDRIGRLVARASGDVRRLPPVLIQGETGTGKGLVARALHRAGPRARGPFVDVNCAAIPETLLEAEMFGFERGAFTDARQGKRGLFQAAHQGTLFLDEVGLLPAGLQAKLLKVIEERAVRRLGSTRSEPVDVWIVAATNADLSLATRERRFREDLYHRLAVLTLVLPPLRERGGDVLRLAEHFLKRASVDYGLVLKTLTPEARRALVTYPWPGNVRELANVMERIALLAETPVVTAEMLGLSAWEAPRPASPRAPSADSAGEAEGGGSLVDPAERPERGHLLEVLQAARWNVSQAAARLGVSRNTLRYRMEKYGLGPEARPRRPPAATTSAARPPAEPSPTSMERPPAAKVRWERRRLTLLRAALTPSLEEASPLPASRVLEVFVDKIQSFGGRVEELSASGVVGVFGLESLEHAAWWAANAALAIHRAAERARGEDGGGPAGPEGARIAIHVASLVVGRVGDAVQIEADAKGEAWTAVEALVARAEPGAILVSSAAFPFLERRFDLIPAGSPGPFSTEIYRPTRTERPPFESGRRLAPFMGRLRELTLLRDLLMTARTDRAQVVGIVGEPGIGKSRLLYEFRQSLAAEAIASVEAHCLEYGSAPPYLPILEIIRQSCGIAETDSSEVVVGKVRLAVEQAELNPDERVPYLLRFLGVKEGAEGLGAASPEAIRTRSFETLRQLLSHPGRRRPLVLAIEDLHWVDPSSEALLGSLVDGLQAAPILFVATYRPGYRPPWVDRSYATQLAIGPLSWEQSLAVVQAVLQGAATPASLSGAIVEKAQGNPFFLEELARAVREQGGVSPSVPVPNTVEELVLGRIDRLPVEDKRVLQVAAVVGKNVPLVLLRAVADLPEDVLRGTLGRLQTAELLYETATDRDAEHVFNHTLIQEVAYGSLLEGERRALHARILETIEREGSVRRMKQIEALAHHAYRAAQWDKAVGYLHQAGLKAAARSANREAVAWLEQALGALERVPPSGDAVQLGIDLRLDLRNSLIPLGKVERILELLRQAEALAQSLHDERRHGRVLSFLSSCAWVMGDHAAALDAARQTRTLALRLQDSSLLVYANVALSWTYHSLGDYRQGVRSARETVESLTGDLVWERFGVPSLPAVNARAWLASCQAELGEFSGALARAEEAVQLAERSEEPWSLVAAYLGLGVVRLRKGDLGEAVPALERGLEVCRRFDIHVWLPPLAASLGYALALFGRVGEATPLLTSAVEHATATGLFFYRALATAWLSEAQLLAGGFADAERRAVEALRLCQEHAEAGNEAHTLRLLGQLHAAGDTPDVERSEALYRQALARATALEMRPLVAQCHLGLGELSHRAERWVDARRELTRAAALFRELDMRPGAERAEDLLERPDATGARP